MPIVDALGELKRMAVLKDTWGHLAPKPRRRYRGAILIAESVYPGQGRTIIRCDFVGLDDSPWFYDALTDHVYDLEGLEDGRLYLWTGTFQFFKCRGATYVEEGAYRFDGSFQEVTVPYPFPLSTTH